MAMDPLFPQKTIFGLDAEPFKYPLNELFNPVYLTDIVKSSVIVEVKEPFRIDKATQDIDYSSKYLKTVHIINGKDKGIFSYKVGDQVYAPMPDAINNANADYNNLDPFSKEIELDVNIKETFSKSADEFQENINQTSQNIALMYVKNPTPELIIYDYEKTVSQKFPGIIEVE